MMPRSAGLARREGSGRIILIASLATTPPAVLVAQALSGPSVAMSVSFGAGLAALSALGGGWLQARVMPMPPRYFLAAVAGSFLGRMLLFGVAVVVLVRGTDLPVAPFVAALFSYYFLYQILEIWIAHRRSGALPSR